MGTGTGFSGGGRSGRSLVGQKFARLLVIRDSGLRSCEGGIRWECLCDCGTTRYLTAGNLRNGNTKSCGCWNSDRMRIEPPATTHGGSGTYTYTSWVAMKRRCIDTKAKDYPLYGGRGISICSRWLQSYANFLEDMGERSIGMTLDRINSNGNYCKENCRWATRRTQGNNTSRNHVLTYRDTTHTLAEWSKITGIAYTTLRARINLLKWSTAKALEKENDDGEDYENRETGNPGVCVRPRVFRTPRL